MNIIISDNHKKKIKNAISNMFNSEIIWTYFIAYIIDKSNKKNEYLKYMCCDENIGLDDEVELWIEPQPKSPYTAYDETNTHLDLAFGAIEKREETKTGIKYKSGLDFVCFVEAKLFSDCSIDTTYDPLRNQIVRIIENLACFQDDNGNFCDKLYFTLLTPKKIFKNPKSRLYGYKIIDYSDAKFEDMKDKECLRNLSLNIANVTEDLNVNSFTKRKDNTWKYPVNLEENLKKIKISWVTYEYFLEKELNLPEEFDLIDAINKPSLPIVIYKKLEELMGELKKKN